MNCSLKDDTYPWREVFRKVLFVVGLSNQGLDDSYTQGLLYICVSASGVSEPLKMDNGLHLGLHTLHCPVGGKCATGDHLSMSDADIAPHIQSRQNTNGNPVTHGRLPREGLASLWKRPLPWYIQYKYASPNLHRVAPISAQIDARTFG
jgi:hypothetical protein